MFLCCGEAIVDMLPLAGDRPSFAAHTGGSAYNSAVALARLGGDVGLLAGISHDPLGEMLMQGLQAAGVRTDWLIRSVRPSPLALIHLEQGNARYSFHDAGSAGRMIRPGDLPDLPRAQAVLFGGLSLATAPVADTLTGLAERLVSAPGPRPLLMLDPNVRPALIEDEAAYRARLARLLPLANIIKLSRDDLNWLWPGLPRSEQIAAVMAHDPALLCLTLDAEGAEIHRPGHPVQRAPARAQQVVDTVGAGDTVNAVLLLGLRDAEGLDASALRGLEGARITAILQRAMQAAAITVSRPGADPPTRAELATPAGHTGL